MSDKPFISTEAAFRLIERMRSNPAVAGRLNEDAMDAFEDMYERGVTLTAKQLLWVQRVALDLDLLEEPATNEWSSRTLQERERIRGREVPTPPALLQKPLRPPHRLNEISKKS